MSESVLESLVVPAALAGERVDRAVALLTGWSRAEVQVLIDDAAVLVDGKTVIKSRRLAEGEVIELLAEPRAGRSPAAAGDPARRRERRRRRDRHRQARRAHRASRRRPPGRHVGERAPRPVSRDRRRRRPGAPGHRAPARREHQRPARRRRARRSPTTRSSPRSPRAPWTAATSRWCGAPPSRRAGWSTHRSAARSAGRRAWRFARVAARPAPGTRSSGASTIRTSACCVARSRPGAPIRSACISRRSTIRSSAIPAYGGIRAGLDIARPFLHAATLAFAHPVTGEPQRFASELPPDLVRVLDQLDG